jgi:curved DNA-binding protein CbpA
VNTNVATSKQEVPKDLQDLYAVLGVSKEATPEEIKQAYRQAALKYHPDRTNGDPDLAKVFQAVQHAYDILSDEQKRRYYDETGKIRPSEQQLQAEAQDVLDSNIISCIDALVESQDPNAERINPIQEVRNKLSMDIRNAQHNLQLLRKSIKSYEKMAQRMKSKKNPEFDKSPVGILISSKVDNLKDSIDKVQNAIEIHSLALKMIDDYSYELESMVPGSVVIDPFAAHAMAQQQAAVQAQQQAMANMFFQKYNR